MLELDFLEADEPLTKTIAASESGNYDITPYPFASRVTSHRERVNDINGVYAVLLQHAALNRCLLKGLLNAQLNDESRRGQTIANAPTRYLVLDLDFHEGWASVDQFVDELDPSLTGVSYIFQHSASAGIKGPAGLRGHVFILLDEPVAPLQLKTWLKIRNFQVPKLNVQLTLANNNITLKWPLDITTCQNDKLIYIAPPVCQGFDDPLAGQRFVLRERSNDFAPTPELNTAHVALLQQWEQEKINDLRAAMGLPRRKPRFKQSGELEILTNPSPGVVTSHKMARGFTYVNLNGGDSWGYYFPAENPSILYNFKGEPPVFLKDIAPEFHSQYQQVLAELKRQEIVDQLGTSNFETLVFRDIVTDTYYNGYYFPDEDRVQLHKAATVQRLQHFKMQHNEEPPEFIEDWTVTFDPTRLEFYDANRKWINNYTPSHYLRDNTLTGHCIPPIIDRVLESITGHDIDAKWHFINWLAHIYQTRQKTGTAWIFHGIEGTGKGLLFSKVLRPLFGAAHTMSAGNKNIEDGFNDSLQHANIVFIDELEMASVQSAAQFMATMKNYITEDFVMVRAMRVSARQVRTFFNFIIATNKQTPVHLSPTDRRFNVCPPQEKKLVMTTAEIESIDQELPQFAGFLRTYKVSVAKTREVLMNDAREALIQSSQTSVERFFEAARKGQINYFLSFLNASNPMDNTYYYAAFETVLERWCRHAIDEDFCNVARDELQTAYTYILGRPTGAAKFQRMMAMYRIDAEQVDVMGKLVTGYNVMWGGDKIAIQRFLDGRGKPHAVKQIVAEGK